MKNYSTKALDESSWPEFARLVEENNGVWGGCWCMWYHTKDKMPMIRWYRSAEQKNTLSEKAAPMPPSTTMVIAA